MSGPESKEITVPANQQRDLYITGRVINIRAVFMGEDYLSPILSLDDQPGFAVSNGDGIKLPAGTAFKKLSFFNPSPDNEVRIQFLHSLESEFVVQ